MSINLHNLSDNVAIKFNDEVHFGKDSVKKFIKNNGDMFLNFDLKPIDDSHMLYGYNSLDYPVKMGFKDGKIQRIIITSPKEYLRYLITLSYDGRDFSGFQIQNKEKTIQGELSKIVSQINNKETLVQGASRTDAGVHAINQKAHFDTDRDLDLEKWIEIFNHQLDKHIYVKNITKVHPLFHARYDVYRKRYIYKLRINDYDPMKCDYSWFVEEVDITKLKQCMNELVGTYDFTSFSKGENEESVRTIYKTDIVEKRNEIILVFEGNGFLRHMIRLIVNYIIDFSKGKINIPIKEIIRERSREHTKHMAPASGLYLEKIFY